ncbi:LysR family transcriptional regulator [Dactylosporangium sp. CA-233914]|uniref:LysR family transcriptional regulator n=1 Tax=Dactylosporangium sp. CA-233914 TaxID=3239934 RepID=UPI003D8B1CE2
MLDPWRLKLLADLASLGTVRAVAQSAHLSPSTVSQQLSVLERESGARLFERAGRRLRLTEAGETLARHARVILDQMDTARAEIAGDTAPTPTGRLTIGAFTSAANTFVLAAVQHLHTQAPRLRVDIQELDPTETLPALRRGACDVAVTADLFDSTAPAPVDAEILHTPLATDHVVLVTPAPPTPLPLAAPPHLGTPPRAAQPPAGPGSHTPPVGAPPAPRPGTARARGACKPAAPAAASTAATRAAAGGAAAPRAAADDAAPVDLADYAEARWSAERPGSWTHDLITWACRRAGFEPDVTGLFASYGPLLAHVEAGLSVTLLPELAVDPRYRVTARPLREPVKRQITAAVRASAAQRPSIAAVLAALEATAAASR